ncbi:MAG: sulfite exporter TauE/SafE family protein [Clostridia bacterium]|nr:sulfite exporter TauE/SafE family protein [Clostridia bacterium]
MWSIVIYVLITLFATTIGAISGMGGGVIMKPSFDLVGEYNASEIAIVTSCSVFTMSLVSVALKFLGKKKAGEEKPDYLIILFMALGSIVGGYVGNLVFSLITQNASDAVVKITQNCVLITVMIFIIIYMNMAEKPKSLKLKSKIVAVVAGLFLGVISSFLGIGGGPMNVAVIIFLFGYGMKTASICSLAIIIFSQATKIITMTITGGFGIFNVPILIFVLIASVVGAFIGRFITKKVSDKGAKICFLCAQIIIVGLCIYNIVNYSLQV